MPKFPRAFMPAVFAFYMAAIMAFIMCCAITAIQSGLGPDYWRKVGQAYMLCMPIAWGCVVVVRPLVVKLVMLTVKQ